MPAYLISHAAGQRGDMLVEADDLYMRFINGWLVIWEGSGGADDALVLAMPREQVSCVQRVDDPTSHEVDGNQQP